HFAKHPFGSRRGRTGQHARVARVAVLVDQSIFALDDKVLWPIARRADCLDVRIVGELGEVRGAASPIRTALQPQPIAGKTELVCARQRNSTANSSLRDRLPTAFYRGQPRERPAHADSPVAASAVIGKREGGLNATRAGWYPNGY